LLSDGPRPNPILKIKNSANSTVQMTSALTASRRILPPMVRCHPVLAQRPTIYIVFFEVSIYNCAAFRVFRGCEVITEQSNMEGHALSWPHKTIGRDGARPSIMLIIYKDLHKVFPSVSDTSTIGCMPCPPAKRLFHNVILRLQPKNLHFKLIDSMRFFTSFRMTKMEISSL